MGSELGPQGQIRVPKIRLISQPPVGKPGGTGVELQVGVALLVHFWSKELNKPSTEKVKSSPEGRS